MADFLKAAGVSREPLGHIQLLVLFPNSSHKLPCRPPALQAWDANVATSEFLLTCVLSRPPDQGVPFVQFLRSPVSCPGLR